jgi:hypothetical protein
MTLLRTVLVGAALSMTATGVHAEALRKVIDELVESPAPSVAVEQANAAALESFESALKIYDRQIEQQPADVVVRLKRCEFMQDFAASYEVAEFAGKVSERGEDCLTQFARAYPGHPEIQLRNLQTNMFGADMMERGEALLAEAQARRTWTNGQLGRLYTMLAEAADRGSDDARALKYALLALEADEESPVQLIAATRLITGGNKERALEILRSPVAVVDDEENAWDLSRRMRLFVQAGAAQDALALYPRLQKARYYSHGEAAQLLLTAGASELARNELALAAQSGNHTPQEAGALFRLELEHGTTEAAFAAYQAWRDTGWKVDPLGINRVALLTRDLSLPLRARDLASLFVLIGAAALLGLLAAIPMVAAHYRGLVVRARSGEPYPQAEWPLRTAWLALTAFLVSSVLGLYFARGLDLRIDGDAVWEFTPTAEQLSRIGLAGSLLGIAMMLPFALRARRRERAWWTTHWSIGKCLAVGVTIAIAVRIPLLLAWAAKPDAVRALAPQDMLWQMLGAVREQYGIAAALWIVAVAAPVTEEFLFRGVLYRAFAAHLRPLWANLLQASLFAALHLQEFKGTVLLFLLGLALGTLTRRSGGLLAALTLHATFNLIAGLIILLGGT